MRRESVATIAAIAVAALVLGELRNAFFYVFFLPATALVLLAWTTAFSAGRRSLLILCAGSAVAAVSLVLAGWGVPLTSAQVELEIAKAHPNFRLPIRCHRVGGGGLLAQRYDCTWRGSGGGMGFDVDDSHIVAEYP